MMMITILLAIHPACEEDKLNCMKTALCGPNPPNILYRIRVVELDGRYIAIEGSHRLAAAAAVRHPVELIVLSPDDLVDADDGFDWVERPGKLRAGSIAGLVKPEFAVTMTINPDRTLTVVPRPAEEE